MDKKMTSGEIAKKVGISQKAVRLYDEKGLLKPSDYSEGNYRLYDKEALLVLEKIIALKKIGFSLEEIHDNLIAEKDMNIADSLQKQLELMEAKKSELERTIACIQGVLARAAGEPDWDGVAEIARAIQQDQEADDRHFHALKHMVETVDWYVRIYESLNLSDNSKVLDLGCGFGKLWRNNWSRLPKHMSVQGVDLHGSWADDLEKFIAEHRGELPEGTDMSILWADVEEARTWEALRKDEPYDYIVAHYLFGFLKDKELLVQRVAETLCEGGMFSCNGSNINYEYQFWAEQFAQMKWKPGFLGEIIAENLAKHEAFGEMLGKYFGKVETVRMSNTMRYKDSQEIIDRLCSVFAEHKKAILEQENRIKAFYDKMLAEEGQVVVEDDGEFWHCYK